MPKRQLLPLQPLPQLADDAAVRLYLKPLQPYLDRADVLEVCVNRPGEAFIESFKSGWERVLLPDLDLEHCIALAGAVATATGDLDNRCDESQPFMSATLPGGERAWFVVPPACLAGTVSITIRKPPTLRRSMQDLEEQGYFRGVVSAMEDLQPYERDLLALKKAGKWSDFFKLAVQQGLTIVLSGKTGSSKTSFMRTLVDLIPEWARIITIENADELDLPRHPNSVRLFYAADADESDVNAITPRRCEKATKRMRPDWIFLAEVTGEECFYFVRAIASGHHGMTSVHARNPAMAIEQMALMIRQSKGGAGMDMSQIKRLLHLAIDVVAQCERMPDGDYRLSSVYFDPERKLRIARGQEQA